MDVHEIVLLREHGLITHAEARDLLGFAETRDCVPFRAGTPLAFPQPTQSSPPSITSTRRPFLTLADRGHRFPQHCAICGQTIHEGTAAVPIKGVHGEGVRHADYAICMDAARENGDPYD